MMFFLAFLCAAFFGAVVANTGVDVSQRTYSSSFSCMKSYGYSFAIVRVYQSNGVCDPNGPATINDAWTGGMRNVEGYIYAGYSGGKQEKQM